MEPQMYFCIVIILIIIMGSSFSITYLHQAQGRKMNVVFSPRFLAPFPSLILLFELIFLFIQHHYLHSAPFHQYPQYHYTKLRQNIYDIYLKFES